MFVETPELDSLLHINEMGLGLREEHPELSSEAFERDSFTNCGGICSAADCC